MIRHHNSKKAMKFSEQTKHIFIAVYVILESTHFHSRVFTFLRSIENGASLIEVIFKTLKPIWCIQRKRSISILRRV